MQSDDVLGRVAGLPPGPELACALASIEPATVSNDFIVDVLQAQARQLAHEQARLLATIIEVGRSRPGAPDGAVRRAQHLHPWAAGEVAAALTLTARSADRELDFADTLVNHLPTVFAALLAGRLDRAKAWVFTDHLHPGACGLTESQIEALCAHLVPAAFGWTTGQLTARLLRAIIAIDPTHARRRYEKAVSERAVSAYLDRDGTVTLTATGLPPDQAASASERLEHLAATVKRAGHPGRLAHIETDLFLGLLDGRYHHHTQDQIVADLLRRAATSDGPTTDIGHSPQSAEHAASQSPTGSAEHAASQAPGRSSDNGEFQTPEQAADHPGSRSTTLPHSSDDRPVSEQAGSEQAGSEQAGSEQAGSERAGIEIRIGLLTLLGLDERPGEIPGLGPVIADVGRAAVAAQVRGSAWRFAVTDPDGQLLLAGPIRRRPKLNSSGPRLGGVVEIHISATLLAPLINDQAACGPWAVVVVDIADQYARRELITAEIDRHPAGRFARAALARHIQVRDRTCTHPGCLRPARKSDLDHTVGYASGGPTTSTNTGPSCRRHHFYKSELGWRLRQPAPGRFEWISPLGRVSRTCGEAINPALPEPVPRTPRPPPGTALLVPPATDDDPPPF